MTFTKLDQYLDQIGIDKYMHFGVSLLLGVVASLFIHNQWWAFGAAMVPGIGKEAWDSRVGGSGWSWGDIVADAIGCVCGLFVLDLLRIL